MKKARVIEEHKTNYIISHEGTEFVATVRGTFFADKLFPKVGDFVTYEEVGDNKAVIETIEPRTSMVVRKAVETGEEQVIATNVDIIFIVMGLDHDFNMSRLERYLVLATQSNVAPVIILNKCDSVADVDTYISTVTDSVGEVPVHAVSALTGEGMEAFMSYLMGDVTAVLLGSSGAGKSTISNWLLAAPVQEVGAVRRNDSRGRHTTTSRQLFALAKGGFLIDTPGMRELSLLDSREEDERAVFDAIEQQALACKFSNCDHEKSQGCAVLEAIAAGEISKRQLESYQKLLRERKHEEEKQSGGFARMRKQKEKKLQKSYLRAHQQKRSERE